MRPIIRVENLGKQYRIGERRAPYQRLRQALTGIVEGCRSAFFARPIDGTALAISTGITAGVLVYAAYAFRRMESRFTDVI
jgi:hypothetical protein